MKNSLIAIAIIFIFSSCKKSATPPTDVNINSTLLVGKWFYTTDTIKYSTNGGAFKVLSTISNYNRTAYEQFNSDGTGIEIYNNPAPFTYIVANNKITFNFPAQTYSGIIIPAFTKTATIRYVTENSLSILYYDTSINNGVTEIDYEAQYFNK